MHLPAWIALASVLFAASAERPLAEARFVLTGMSLPRRDPPRVQAILKGLPGVEEADVDFGTRQATVSYRTGAITVDAMVEELERSRQYGARLMGPVITRAEGRGVALRAAASAPALRPGGEGRLFVELTITAGDLAIHGDAEHPGLRAVLEPPEGVHATEVELTQESVEGATARLAFELRLDAALAAGERLVPYELVYVPEVKGKTREPITVRSTAVLRVGRER